MATVPKGVVRDRTEPDEVSHPRESVCEDDFCERELEKESRGLSPGKSKEIRERVECVINVQRERKERGQLERGKD
jgi:hypothetical protein